MYLSEAIEKADNLRPNVIEDDMKVAWVEELEGKIADMMEIELPEMNWPTDFELLMPSPRDNLYVWYLCAMIDASNSETTAYANDMVVYNNMFSEASAWYRRSHRYESNEKIKGI